MSQKSMLQEGKTCPKCQTWKAVDQFSRSARRKDGLCIWCKPCSRQSQSLWASKNKPRISANNRRRYTADKDKHAAKNALWRNNPDNKEKAAAYAREYYQQHRERLDAVKGARRRSDPSAYRTYAKRWREANPHKLSAKSAARRAATRAATPKWADLEKVELLFAIAVQLKSETGEPYEVDHSVPITPPLVQGLDRGNPLPKRSFVGPLVPVVQGLHCEANMRVITARENRAKSNRSWPDMPDIKI